MRRTGVRASLWWNFIIHQIFPEFLQPLRDFRTQRRSTWVGKQRVSQFYRGFLLFGFGIFGWLRSKQRVSHSIIASTCELDTGTGWESIPLRSSFSRVSLSLYTVVVGEVDELEEDVGWLISCLEGVIEVEKMRTGGRTRWQAWNHDRNEVFRVTLYPNPFFDEMWFLTADPFIRMSVFIAKLSKR